MQYIALAAMYSHHRTFRDNQGKRRFQKKKRAMEGITKFEVPIEHQKPRGLRNKNKRLVNKSTGVGYDIPAGYNWVEICRDILKDGTCPNSLAKVARGQLKSTNGWQVTLLD
jgi:hypothetical protein